MPDLVGQRLGNYQLTRYVGSGSFADVYLGEQVYLQTQAAVKVLHARLNAEDLDGFLAEARTIAHLVHPAIVRVLDFGVQEGTPIWSWTTRRAGPCANGTLGVDRFRSRGCSPTSNRWRQHCNTRTLTKSFTAM